MALANLVHDVGVLLASRHPHPAAVGDAAFDTMRSSAFTGSTVFDFEGDGKAEVIYGDECLLWVFDGTTGAVRYATSHTSFTGTEASLIADVDGDGQPARTERGWASSRERRASPWQSPAS